MKAPNDVWILAGVVFLIATVNTDGSTFCEVYLKCVTIDTVSSFSHQNISIMKTFWSLMPQSSYNANYSDSGRING
jgi:hypothetical protein